MPVRSPTEPLREEVETQRSRGLLTAMLAGCFRMRTAHTHKKANLCPVSLPPQREMTPTTVTTTRHTAYPHSNNISSLNASSKVPASRFR